ncbi:MAG: hypothetical protein ACJ78L_12580 [Chloroflexota bacterium]
MNDDRRFQDLLSDVLATPPRMAPDGLLDAVIEDVRVTGQRISRRPAMLRRTPGQRSPWRLLIAAALVCVVGSVAVIGLTPLSGIVLPQPTSTPTPSAVTTPAPSHSILPATAIESLTHLEPGVTYTSDLFMTRMTFKVRPRDPGNNGDEWCTPVSVTTRAIVFAHAKSCRQELRFLRPYEVSCGTSDIHPDADAVAEAILANPAMAEAVDLGTLQTPGAVPRAMFAADYHGRVIQLPARFAPYAGGQRCLLLDELVGRAPLLEITGDFSMRLVLVDVHGELLVIQAWGEGTGGVSEFMHLLTVNYDIRFE